MNSRIRDLGVILLLVIAGFFILKGLRMRAHPPTTAQSPVTMDSPSATETKAESGLGQTTAQKKAETGAKVSAPAEPVRAAPLSETQTRMAREVELRLGIRAAMGSVDSAKPYFEKLVQCVSDPALTDDSKMGCLGSARAIAGKYPNEFKEKAAALAESVPKLQHKIMQQEYGRQMIRKSSEAPRH